MSDRIAERKAALERLFREQEDLEDAASLNGDQVTPLEFVSDVGMAVAVKYAKHAKMSLAELEAHMRHIWAKEK